MKPWIVIGEGGMQCLNCGALAPTPLPVDVEQLGEMTGAFIRAHSRCVATTYPVEVPPMSRPKRLPNITS